MVLGKRWLFLIGNGAEIRPLEKGRKGPVVSVAEQTGLIPKESFFSSRFIYQQ